MQVSQVPKSRAPMDFQGDGDHVHVLTTSDALTRLQIIYKLHVHVQ